MAASEWAGHSRDSRSSGRCSRPTRGREKIRVALLSRRSLRRWNSEELACILKSPLVLARAVVTGDGNLFVMGAIATETDAPNAAPLSVFIEPHGDDLGAGAHRTPARR